ncbi:MAG: c-type cytochrome [Betaproteobacteria bacterium]
MRVVYVSVLAALAMSGFMSCSRLAFAAGDAALGRMLYQRTCFGCHGDKETVQNVGPSLVGVLGRRAGTVAGTPYSRKLYEAAIVWDEKSLNRYLASPWDAVHGTIMPVGVHDPRQRDDIIAYLQTLR